MRSSVGWPAEGAGARTRRLPPLIVICGPTATGKTALSLALAERLPRAEIISADSRQVYRGMDIGTAKATAADRSRVTHHGLDLVGPDEPFTVAAFRRHALDALAGIGARGGVALLVGGTGLYIRAVARDVPLDEEASSDASLRQAIERQIAGEGLHVAVARLRATAPGVADRTDLANPRRVARALERAEILGDTPPPSPRGYAAPSLWIGLDTDVGTNDGWIDERARWQFANGLLEEAAALRERYDPMLPPFSAMGYREAFAVLDREMHVDRAIELDARRTRKLARRQRSWFRAEPGVVWLDASAEPLDAALAAVGRLGLG